MKFPGLFGFQCVLLAICVVGTCWFYRRRHHHPLPGRYPSLSIFNAIIIALTIANTALPLVATFSCYIVSINYSWLLPLPLICVVLRAFMLLGQYEILKHIRLITSFPLQQAATIPLPWFVRHRNWIRPINVFRGILVFTMVMIAWWTLFVAASTHEAFGHTCDVLGATGEYDVFLSIPQRLTMTYVVPSLIALAILGRGLSRQENDAFGVRKELRTILLTCSCIATTAIIDIGVGIAPWYSELAGTMAMFAMFAPTILFPIRMSYQFQAIQRRQAGELHRVKTVEELLALPQGYELFVSYCQTEFCSEGLNFWQRVTSFKANCNCVGGTADHYHTCLNDAHDIVNTFIINGSAMEVNISYELRTCIMSSLETHMSSLPPSLTQGAGAPGTGTGASLPPPTMTGSPMVSQHVLGSSSHKLPLQTAPSIGHISVTIAANNNSQQGSRVMSPEPTMDSKTNPATTTATTTMMVSPLASFATIFDDACNVCLHLLQAGAFQRFTTSTMFKTFADGLQSGQSSKQAMEHAVMSVLQPSASMDDEVSSLLNGNANASRNGNSIIGGSRMTPMANGKKIGTPVGASSRVASPMIGSNCNGSGNGMVPRGQSPLIRGPSPNLSTSTMATNTSGSTIAINRPLSFTGLSNTNNTSVNKGNPAGNGSPLAAQRAGAYAVAGGINHDDEGSSSIATATATAVAVEPATALPGSLDT